MHKSAVASIIALLNAKIGSSSFNRCSGIFLMSVSSPTQRNDFLRFMFSNNCCLSILLFTILQFTIYYFKKPFSTLNSQLSTSLKFAFFQAFCIFRYDQMVDTILDVSVHEGCQIIDCIVDAVVGDTSLGIVVSSYFG